MPFDDSSDRPSKTQGSARKRVRLRRALLIAGPVVALLGALAWYLGGGGVSTDNAYVQAKMVTISADVPGRIVAVDVVENQRVRKGDVLFRIDDRSYRVALERAEAQLAAARDQVASLKAAYRQAADAARLATVDVEYARKQFDRVERLAKSGYAAKAALDQARHDLDAARQRLAVAQQQQSRVRAQLGGDPDAAPDQTAAVKSALAARDAAQLDLERTTVRAPFDGVASQKPDVGRYVAAGLPVMSVVADTGLWVDANFKETELSHIAPGQPATIQVDAYPGQVWHGTVQSISQASGAEFSVLPPQNATGNWVKVVQRITVRVAVTPRPGAPQLRAGMSANVSVDTGRERTLADLIP